MNYKIHSTIVLLSFTLHAFIACSGCSDNPKQPSATANGYSKEQLQNINLYLTEKDKDIIESHIRRQEWKMTYSPDGYYYEIFEEGSMPKAADKDKVIYEYIVNLLDGTPCYKSDEPQTFVVGFGDIPGGVHLAVKRLGKGGRGRFIFPPQLAYGLQGDQNKIPQRAVIVYELSVIDIKEADNAK